MARKGMSTSLKVAVVALVLLIVAVVVLAVFTGGMDRVSVQIDNFFKWISGNQIGEQGETGDDCTNNFQCKSLICENGKCT